MIGNCHVRFLGEGKEAIPEPYPTVFRLLTPILRLLFCAPIAQPPHFRSPPTKKIQFLTKIQKDALKALI